MYMAHVGETQFKAEALRAYRHAERGDSPGDCQLQRTLGEKVRVGGGVSERRKTPDEATSSAGFEVSWAVWA